MNKYEESLLKMAAGQNPQPKKLPRSLAKRKHSPIPIKKVVFALIGTLVFGAGYLFVDEIVDWTAGIEEISFQFATPVQAQVRPAEIAEAREKAAALDSGQSKPIEAAVDSANDKDSSYLQMLKSKETSLNDREANLNELAEELQRQKNELAVKLKELDQMRENISQILKDRVATDNERVKKLVEFYGSMKPENAARLFEKLDEDLAIEILQKMKKTDAGNILNMMNVDKAQKLSERFAGYKS